MAAMRRTATLAVAVLGAGVTYGQSAASPSAGDNVRAKPFHANGIYKTGEAVGWNFSGSGEYTYSIRENNAKEIENGTLDLSGGEGKIEVTVDEPAMLYLQLKPVKGEDVGAKKGRPMAFGAAVSPLELKPVQERPADFDSFWQSKIEALEQVPTNAQVTPEESDNPEVEYDTVRLDHLDGGHVWGHLAKPKKEGKFPGMVIFQWASPPYPLQREWVTRPASEGWLALNIEPHDVLPSGPKSYYDGLPKELKNYQTIGYENRDTNYFLKMYLADYRAVEYLASRPDWDGKILLVTGTSMGGQQSLCVAGLDPKVTHLIVDEPAGCDLNAGLHGRQEGYPFWPTNNEKVMAAAPYFDPIHFASHIHATSLVAMGFVDTIAPPAGIWTAFDQIQGKKEAVPMLRSPHNNYATSEEQAPFTKASGEWMSALVKGEEPHVRTIWEEKAVGMAPPADVPVERMDKNSQLAHQQLLEKAASVKNGAKIDVYFEGDSITRRWGCSDPMYAHFLANWKKNFYGWNAADFGWGGDTTNNILWRLDHGELDGVNPKVIVLMAGTNNIGFGRKSAGDPQEKAADVAKGVEAIVQRCEEKAPGAVIVVMGVTPRRDPEWSGPVVEGINKQLAAFADGKKVRFLNINDKLVDANGKQLPQMFAGEGLHLEEPGYQVWADALKPVLQELLGPPAATDSAPAPTADPSSLR